MSIKDKLLDLIILLEKGNDLEGAVNAETASQVNEKLATIESLLRERMYDKDNQCASLTDTGIYNDFLELKRVIEKSLERK